MFVPQRSLTGPELETPIYAIMYVGGILKTWFVDVEPSLRIGRVTSFEEQPCTVLTRLCGLLRCLCCHRISWDTAIAHHIRPQMVENSGSRLLSHR